uniref:Uncharacterized protein n=1 Tax=Triticum urartu TaxID=4572 RepID=A0A8R7V6T2_TRIUA
MLNAERKCRAFNATGIASVRLLLDKSSTCKFVRLQTDCGISPDSLLKLKSRAASALSWPICGGITPVK